jgi:hypothetical protein
MKHKYVSKKQVNVIREHTKEYVTTSTIYQRIRGREIKKSFARAEKRNARYEHDVSFDAKTNEQDFGNDGVHF